MDAVTIATSGRPPSHSFVLESSMHLTPIPYERPPLLETFALRGLAVVLAPVLFTVTVASLPAAALRWALSR